METNIPEGTVIGQRWRVVGFLGSGGFGQVFLVEDVSELGLGEAALKVLHPNTSPQERNDFIGEVKKIAVLRHQNLVGYLDSGQTDLDGAAGDGQLRPYLVTELCEQSLEDRLGAVATSALSTEETVGVVTDLATGLAHLHERGLIHRDIKPGNALFADGRWKLADFGLMRDLSATGTYHRGELLIGTPLYMAPELFSTNTATAPSDVYALGVLAHRCATGRTLHSGTGPALMHNVATQPPTIDPSIDPMLGDIVRRCTIADPAGRPTAVEMIRALDTPWAPPASGHGVGVPAAGSSPATRPVGPPPGPAGQAAPPTQLSSAGLGAQGGGAGTAGRWPLLAAIGVVALVALAGVAALALRGDDTPPTDTADTSQAAAAGNSGTGGSPDGEASAGDPSVLLGDDVEVGEGVIVGDGDSSDTGTDGSEQDSLTDVASHIDNTPCAGGTPTSQIELTNRHSAPVDYQVMVHHFNESGVRVSENVDTVRALRPGERALMGVKSFDETSVSCEIDMFNAVVTNPANVAAVEDAGIVDCVFDEFFGNSYDITYFVGNTLDVAAIANTAFAVVDADGVRIDESFTDTVFGIEPGERVQQEVDATFWNMDAVERETVGCIITSVELVPDPTR